MSIEVIFANNIKLGVPATDWQDAMRQSGQILVNSEFITQEYITSTIKAVEEFGPYIVIAPGLAIAHARPDDSVLKTGLSLVTLSSPVNFGCDLDPVDIVITLAAKNNDDHHEMLQKLSFYLSEEGTMDYIRTCTSPKELAAQINEFEIEP